MARVATRFKLAACCSGLYTVIVDSGLASVGSDLGVSDNIAPLRPAEASEPSFKLAFGVLLTLNRVGVSGFFPLADPYLFMTTITTTHSYRDSFRS